MSTIMELSERVIQVRSTAKHEKNYPSFTQDDIVFLFEDVIRPVALVLNNNDPFECLVLFPSAALCRISLIYLSMFMYKQIIPHCIY